MNPTRHLRQFLLPALALSVLLFAGCGGQGASDSGAQGKTGTSASATNSSASSFDGDAFEKAAALNRAELASAAVDEMSAAAGRKTGAARSASGADKFAADTRVPVYRFYVPTRGVHFYTASESEKQAIEASLSATFQYEGVAFHVSGSAAPGLHPVYRYFNSASGTHFYTISTDEKAYVDANLPALQYEGIAFYASRTAGSGLLALTRFFQTQAGSHFYTRNDAEAQNLRDALSALYREEGVAFYVIGPVDNCPSIDNPGQEDSDGDGIGDACDELDPSFSGIVDGGGIAAAGVGLAGRNSTPTASATVNLTGIPTGATILSATAYWMTIGAGQSTITIDGTPLTGTLFGTAPDTCWGRAAGNFAYRADVTGLVTGNGAHTVTDYPSQASGDPDGQGITIMVVYSDPADSRHNLVSIAEGSVGFVGDGRVAINTLDGFTVGAGFGSATLINVVADGQPFPEELFFEGTQIGGSDPFPGAEGPYWDTRIDNVTSLVVPGATSLETELTASGDCLAWLVNAVVITDVDSQSNTVRRASAGAPPLRPIRSKPLTGTVFTQPQVGGGRVVR